MRKKEKIRCKALEVCKQRDVYSRERERVGRGNRRNKSREKRGD